VSPLKLRPASSSTPAPRPSAVSNTNAAASSHSVALPPSWRVRWARSFLLSPLRPPPSFTVPSSSSARPWPSRGTRSEEPNAERPARRRGPRNASRSRREVRAADPPPQALAEGQPFSVDPVADGVLIAGGAAFFSCSRGRVSVQTR